MRPRSAPLASAFSVCAVATALTVVASGAVFTLCVLGASPAAAQPASESLERDARSAFKAGRFRDAAVRFQDAAAAAADPERKARMEVQSAWAHHNEKNPKATRESLKRAFAADPSVDIVPEFYSPEFLRVVDESRKAAAAARPAAPPPPVDLGELKRASTEKLKDGRYAEVIYDLSNVPRGQLDAETRELLARAYDGAGKGAAAAEIRRGGSVAGSPSTLPATGPAGTSSAASSSRSSAGVTSVGEILAGGRSALQRGDAFLAQTAANRALEVDPNSSEAYRLLADSFAARGDKTLAEPMWKKSLQLDERNSATLIALADFYLAERNWDAALSHLRRAAELNPADAGRLLALARKARADGDVAHARMAYASAAQALPASAEIQSEYGALLLGAGDLPGAADALVKAVGARPGDAVVRANLAAVLRRQGLARESEREYREALRIQPDYRPALMGLGALLLSGPSPADAVEPFRKAAEANPADPDAVMGLARALVAAGKPDEAAAVLKSAESTGSAELLCEEGAVAYARGRYALAQGLFEQAIVRDPSSAPAKSGREKATAAASFLRAAGLPPDGAP